MYTGAILSNMSVDLLTWIAKGSLPQLNLGFVFRTDQGIQLPHHMTINLGEFDEGLNDPMFMSCDVELWFEEIVYDASLGVCAVPITLAMGIEDETSGIKLKSKNKCPHVTVCIKPGCKPMLSNQMLESPTETTHRIKLDKKYRLVATVKETN